MVHNIAILVIVNCIFAVSSMIELVLQVASGLIIFVACMFAWSSTILVEEKEKKKDKKAINDA